MIDCMSFTMTHRGGMHLCNKGFDLSKGTHLHVLQHFVVLRLIDQWSQSGVPVKRIPDSDLLCPFLQERKELACD